MQKNKTKIILVEPQMGENIGAAARVMSNFDLEELRIVNPRDSWPNEKAVAMAASGAYILENAKIFDTLEEAVTDVKYIIATGATDRDMEKQVITSYNIGDNLHENMAILFGCEKTGLSNEQLTYADVVLNIPTGKNHSLNLAQAVAVVAYELSKLQDLDKISYLEAENAPKSDLNNMLVHMYRVLDEKGYYKNPRMRPTMEQNLRTLFTKAKLTEQEIRTLRGIISLLEKGY